MVSPDLVLNHCYSRHKRARTDMTGSNEVNLNESKVTIRGFFFLGCFLVRTLFEARIVCSLFSLFIFFFIGVFGVGFCGWRGKVLIFNIDCEVKDCIFVGGHLWVKRRLVSLLFFWGFSSGLVDNDGPYGWCSFWGLFHFFSLVLSISSI